MSTVTQWQLSRESALRYEQIVVPSILGPFAQPLVEWATLPAGATVLDVGCGTGAATRLAAARVGPAGRVIGVDVNAGMIDVAKSLPAGPGAAIEWHNQSAYHLPVSEQTVDVVLCAQVLQFLQDRTLALAEMVRVLKSGGRIALSVWSDLLENPYFEAQAEAVAKYMGPDTAAGLRAVYGLSQAAAIQALLQEAGFVDIELTIQQLDLPFPTMQEFAPRHFGAMPLATSFNAAPPSTQQAVIEEMSAQLAPYETHGGLRIPFRSHLARARK